jgi:hypothetical protein
MPLYVSHTSTRPWQCYRRKPADLSSRFIVVGRPFWRDDGSVVYICCWASPAKSFSGPSPAGLMTAIYSPKLETSGTFFGQIPIIISPQEQGGPVISPGTRWLSCFSRWLPVGLNIKHRFPKELPFLRHLDHAENTLPHITWLTRVIGSIPWGGGLEYLHCSPASRKRRRKGNPVPGDITGPPCSWGYKYGNLALHVERVSYEIVKYGREFCGTWTREWLLWQGPEAIVPVNYRLVLSSERAPHIKKPAIVRQKTKIWLWTPDGSPTPRHTGRLTVGHKLTSTSISTSKARCLMRSSRVYRSLCSNWSLLTSQIVPWANMPQHELSNRPSSLLLELHTYNL